MMSVLFIRVFFYSTHTYEASCLYKIQCEIIDPVLLQKQTKQETTKNKLLTSMDLQADQADDIKARVQHWVVTKTFMLRVFKLFL